MDARKGDAGSCCVTRSQTLRASHSPAQVKGKASQSGAVEGGHEVSASRSCSMHEHAEALQLRSDESHRRTKLKPESKRARDKLHLEALEQPRRAQRSMLAQMPQELLEAILSRNSKLHTPALTCSALFRWGLKPHSCCPFHP
eukprot:1689166-Rhodomonas_salina.2